MASDPRSSGSTSNFSSLATFTYQISEKLNDENHTIWLQQVEPVLRAHQLHRFCAAPQIPSRFLSDADRLVENENPAYTAWEIQDQALLAWLQSSLSPSYLPKVLGCRYSWQLWEKIHHDFDSKTKAQVRNLRSELRSIKKGDRTISQFISRIKSIAHSLLSVGEEIPPKELLDALLDGLPKEYETLVILVSSKPDWFEFEDVEGLLLAYESRAIKQKETLDLVPSLNLTQMNLTQSTNASASNLKLMK